ncbi:MAG: photosystem I assembly protein Ycf3 [Euryarchaeota archaeon ADurb.Bin190]|jgi:tetratricopeptide (TPR) repeat protein|nr:MAG: photosystem I assembly protein Ycf3 [Euryarchaeota archaeon ADurb.Bin190]
MESVSLEDLEEVDLLLTGLEISRGRGNLILCSVASPAYRDKVIAAVAAHFSSRVLPVERGDKLISDLRNARAEKEEILIWTLPERLSDDILDALNNFRELFYDSGVPNLVFITPAGVDEVIWKAPDFWRYRGGYHVLKGEAKGLGFEAIGAFSVPLDFSYKSKDELLRRKRINEHLLEKMQNKKEKANILNELGTISYFLSEPRKAIEFYEQALAIAREIGDRRGEGNALGNLGLAYSDLGEPKKAIEFCEQALAIAREIGDRRGQGNALGNLGNAYSDLGEPKKAIKFYEQALAVVREIGDRWGEGTSLGNLGVAYSELGELRKAIEFCKQALAIAREIGDRRGEGNALGNLGNAYSDLGEPRKAIEFYEQALKISKEIGDRRGEGADLGNLGSAYSDLGEPRKAIKFYEQALKIFEDIEDPYAEKAKRWLQELESS